MDTTKKLNLAKAQKVKAESELKAKAQADEERLEPFQRVIGELSEVVRRGIVVEGLESLSDASDRIEEFGETVKGLMRDVAVQLGNINELEIPSSLVVETIADKSVVDALIKIGDNGELVSKIQKLDEALVLLSVTLKEAQVQGKRPEDYIPVRLVRGIDSALTFITDLPFGGGFSSAGLTDAQLRASPVPVSASIDTTGLATETKQDTLIGHVDGIETLITSTNTKLDTLTTAVNSYGKPTDAYAIQAISDDGTYKYFFFEDSALNYYVMRKTIASSLFLYTKGTGGYATVYQSAILGPSGSPTWASYGTTF